MSPNDYPDLADQISADPDSDPARDNNSNSKNTPGKDHHFSSRRNPERLGNTAPIAYGGCTIAIAVHSAHQTLPSNTPKKFHLYSVMGTFHGPTKTDRKLNTTVTITRNTKTFATRRVVASQTQDDGTERTCAEFFIDFHVEEPAFLTYDPSPSLPSILATDPTDPNATANATEILQRMQADGSITQRQATGFRTMFRMAEYYFETRHCTAGVTSRNLFGLVSRSATPQDYLPIPSKTSYEWIRTQPIHTATLTTEALNMTALAFMMDQALSFVSLNHDHKSFPDAGACSTLEFALRVFTPDVHIGKWHLRERRTVVAGMARTFNEGRLWDQQGKLVCSMTQACILRPPPPPREKGGSKI